MCFIKGFEEMWCYISKSRHGFGKFPAARWSRHATHLHELEREKKIRKFKRYFTNVRMLGVRAVLKKD